jgi:hypothetical protein
VDSGAVVWFCTEIVWVVVSAQFMRQRVSCGDYCERQQYGGAYALTGGPWDGTGQDVGREDADVGWPSWPE